MTHVGRYEIVEELGRGAMGVVYKALDPTIGRTVAIKAIRLSEYQDGEERERIHQRLWREARSAGVLSHPNIVTIYDVVEQDAAAFIVMEYVEGQSLAHLFRRGALPARTELLRYLRQVAEALDYAHQKGVIHRDVKPGNIIISQVVSDREPVAKVADFGVAKFISQDTTHSGTMIGTPSYLSPEQIEGSITDGRSDQFALAVVTYELLTGQKPFDGDNLSALFYQICKQAPKAADLLNPLLPSEANQVLARGMAKEPAQRFTTCNAFLAALLSCFETQRSAASSAVEVRVPPQAIDKSNPVRVRRHLPLEDTDLTREKRTSKVRVISGLLAALAGVGVVSWLLSSGVPAARAPLDRVALNEAKKTVGKTRRKEKQTGRIAPETTAKQSEIPLQSSTTGAGFSPTQPLVSVVFRVEPAGATVRVDERPDLQCVSPCVIALKGGRHTLLATAEGFSDARRIFNVQGESDLPVVLERSMGLLMITSEPSGSGVAVDGKASGQTPVTLRLSAGAHHLALVNGAHQHEETVTVVADEVIARKLRWD